MRTIARMALLALLVITATRGVAVGSAAGDAPRTEVMLGACYCRAAGTLMCTGGLSESECQRRCDEELCDEWFWKERLPCWNWGVGG